MLMPFDINNSAIYDVELAGDEKQANLAERRECLAPD
jgi:hypothetical protein